MEQGVWTEGQGAGKRATGFTWGAEYLLSAALSQGNHQGFLEEGVEEDRGQGLQGQRHPDPPAACVRKHRWS